MKEGWKTKTLGDICEIVNGSTPKKNEKCYWDKREIPWFTIKDLRLQGRIINNTEQKISKKALKDTSLRLLPENSILLCCTASVGEYAITRIPLTTNQQFNGLIIKNENEIIPEFLFWYCATLKEKLLDLSGKTTIDFIPISRLQNIQISIPPLPEQQRIVALLDQAFAAIEIAQKNTEKNLQNTRELFDAYLDQFLQNYENEGNLQSLGEICEIARGGSPRPISSYITKSPDGINWIKIGDTKNVKKYIYKTQQKIRPEGKKRSRYVEEGDLILSNSMSFGHPYILKTNGCIHDGWLVLHRKVINIDKEFLFYVLGSKYVYSQFDSFASGSTVRNLNIGWVEKVKIPIPSLIEQHKIVDKLEDLSEKIEDIERLYNNKKNFIAELKESILQKIFSGEL